MRDTAVFLIGLLLLALRPHAAALQTVTPAAAPPQIARSEAARGAQAQHTEPVNPAGLRLNLKPRPLFSAEPDGTRWELRLNPSPQQPLSEIKLFEKGGVAASIGRDGQMHYRLPSQTFLGGRLGGQLSTNSAKVTLTWPPRK